MLVAWTWASPAAAQSLIQVLAQPTDLASDHFFAENPAALVGKSDGGGLSAAVVPGDDSFGGETEDATEPNLPRRREGYMLSAAYGASLGSDAGLGVLLENTSLRRDVGDGTADRYDARYLQLRYAMEVTNRLRLGLLAHGYTFAMQEMVFSDGVVSDGDGAAVGAGLGVIVGSRDSMFGVTWLPVMRGKVEAEGESRIVTRSQVFNVQLVLPISSKGQWGFGVRIRDSDDNAEFDMAHREFPEGEAPFFSGSVGWRLHTSGRWLLYLMGARDGYERGVDRRRDGELDSSWSTRLKLAIGSDHGGTESFLQVIGRAVEEDDEGGGTKRVIADVHYCGVLTFKL